MRKTAMIVQAKQGDTHKIRKKNQNIMVRQGISVNSRSGFHTIEAWF